MPQSQRPPRRSELREIRGKSGKLYAEFDPATCTLIFRKGKAADDVVDLKPLLKAKTDVVQ